MDRRRVDIRKFNVSGSAADDKRCLPPLQAIHDLVMLAYMRRGIAEIQAAINQSRQAIVTTRGAIAFLDRLQAFRISNGNTTTAGTQLADHNDADVHPAWAKRA